MTGYRAIDDCRIGGGRDLVTVLNLGMQSLTGVFPKDASEPVGEGPLELVWSPSSGLLQLGHSYDPGEMYGENYGYRSGLNQSMVNHLKEKVAWLSRRVPLSAGDIVLDIGSNDGTALNAYAVPGLKRIGMDPTGGKFRKYYERDTVLVEDFFSASAYKAKMRAAAAVVTSIAMFYDLEDPVAFARGVAEVLAPEGIWHFEQS